MSIGSIGSTSAYSSAYTSSSRKSSDSKELQEKLFKSIDTDGDGSITSSELTNALGSNSSDSSAVTDLMSALDGNGDGSITSSELSDAMKALQSQLETSFGPPPPPPGARASSCWAPGTPSRTTADAEPPTRTGDADADADGTAEAEADADADADGTTDAVISDCVLDGVVGTDVVTCSGTGDFDTASVGTGKSVTVTDITLGGADNGNYTVSTSYPAATGDIDPLTLTVSPDDQTITYGDATDTAFFTFGVTGFLDGEGVDDESYVAPECGAAYDAGDPAGRYTISCSGGSMDNYVFEYNTATLTVEAFDVPADAVAALADAAGVRHPRPRPTDRGRGSRTATT